MILEYHTTTYVVCIYSYAVNSNIPILILFAFTPANWRCSCRPSHDSHHVVTRHAQCSIQRRYAMLPPPLSHPKLVLHSVLGTESHPAIMGNTQARRLKAGTEESGILHSNELCFSYEQHENTPLMFSPRSNGKQINSSGHACRRLHFADD